MLASKSFSSCIYTHIRFISRLMSYNRRPYSSGNWRDRAPRDRDRYHDPGYYNRDDYGYEGYGYEGYGYEGYNAPSSSQSSISTSTYGGFWGHHAYHPYAVPYRDRGAEVNHYGDNRYYPYATYPDASSSQRSIGSSTLR